MSLAGRPCPSWVKLRRTQCEHMFSALPSNSDIARRIRDVSKVPTGDSPQQKLRADERYSFRKTKVGDSIFGHCLML